MIEPPASPSASGVVPGRGIRWGLRLFLILFAVSALTRLALAGLELRHGGSRRIEFHQLAVSIAEGRGYGNPYLGETGPTAHHTPGYPLLLAGLYSLFGTGRGGDTAEYVTGALIVSALFAMLPFVAGALGLSRRVGVIAALIGIAVPIHYLVEIRGGDGALSAACLAGLTLATALVLERGNFSKALGALHGVGWGVGLLVSPSLLPVCGVWLVLVVMRYRRAALYYGCALAAAALAVLAPWAIRNALVMGSPILFRSNLGLEMQLSYNDKAAAQMTDNIANGDLNRYHPFHNPAEAQRIREIGEVAYNREKMRETLDWMAQNPGKTARLTALRFLLFWFPVTERAIQIPVNWALTLFGLAGLLLAFRRRATGATLIALLWVAYPLTYYALQANHRYRYPILWSLLLMTGYALDCLWRRYGGTLEPRLLAAVSRFPWPWRGRALA